MWFYWCMDGSWMYVCEADAWFGYDSNLYRLVCPD
jgi:hypothetical protein